MAKSRPSSGRKGNRQETSKSLVNGSRRPKNSKPTLDAPTLLARATDLLQTSQPDLALPLALRALSILQPTPRIATPASLPAHTLLGEIQLELGAPGSAYSYFRLAADLDPEGLIPEVEGGGAEKFLWLAQLCEEGGIESVEWFEKGASVLRREITELEESIQRTGDAREEVRLAAEEKRRKLAGALCGIVEVYMTDLSYDPTAESHCSKYITEALLVSPNDPSTFQTLASIRLSQSRLSDAQAALRRSMSLWRSPSTDPSALGSSVPEMPSTSEISIPDFPTRISLARLLMEAEMEEQAMQVLEVLISEDDECVEAWYLGGWCAYLMAQRFLSNDPTGLPSGDDTRSGENAEERAAMLISSREWLRKALELCERLEYEDERLRQHAVELVGELDGLIKGMGGEDESDGDGDGQADEEWEDEGGVEDGAVDDEDHEMNET